MELVDRFLLVENRIKRGMPSGTTEEKRGTGARIIVVLINEISFLVTPILVMMMLRQSPRAVRQATIFYLEIPPLLAFLPPTDAGSRRLIPIYIRSIFNCSNLRTRNENCHCPPCQLQSSTPCLPTRCLQEPQSIKQQNSLSRTTQTPPPSIGTGTLSLTPSPCMKEATS
ncbi:hypothetical protein CEP52_017261 [Fusarium oligoseptatum]|uniref:Uncharacterized protein n=1 Tax=Fusarium oligoseptatum TaxID=2604345 RepID=A0A428RUA0_9HYPO|nr:hypothetical protein CEP52_017261 [Fusarium oligoseptatum]